jgi:hypothetical protein
MFNNKSSILVMLHYIDRANYGPKADFLALANATSHSVLKTEVPKFTRQLAF